MYKLENNVEWTDELKSAFKEGMTDAVILFEGNELNSDNYIKDAELKEHRYVPDNGFIGQAVAKMLTVNFQNDDTSNFNFENGEFVFKIGAEYNDEFYFINYGNFIVDAAPENDETNGGVKVVAYDYMIKFNQPYEDRITYPCTLKNLLIDICNQAGVELSTSSFVNENFEVEDNQFEGKTLREVLQHIAKCAFSWARIGQDNKLYLDFSVAGDVVETITDDEYKQDSFKIANEYYGAINKVTYGDTDIQGQEESVEDTEDISENGIKELVIKDNYFAYTQEKRSTLIQGGIALFGFRYMQIQQMDMTGLAYLDSGDVIEVEYGEEENKQTITSRPFNHTITFNGALNDSVTSEGTSENERVYENTSTPSAKNSRTEVIVDRAAKQIKLISTEIGDREEKTTSITQDIDRIEALVENISELTIGGESDTASVSISDIGMSEPIYINVHPIIDNISYLYPRENLYPDDLLYLPTRNIIFSSDGYEVKYELPDDLLYYNANTYDEFIMDRQNNICKVIKRCKYNADGTVSPLEEPIETNYNYPVIILQDGDYTVSIENYERGYINVSLLGAGVLTTQYVLKSVFNQTAAGIESQVSRKVGEDELSTKIQQDYESVQIAWNKISEYIKFINGQLAIYDNENNLLMSLDKSGQHFYNEQNEKIGDIGTITYPVPTEEGTTNVPMIAFNLNVTDEEEPKGMAWGIQKGNNFYPVFYMVGAYAPEQSEYGGLFYGVGEFILDQVYIDSLKVLNANFNHLFVTNINHVGSIVPSSNLSCNLGDSSHAYTRLYVNNIYAKGIGGDVLSGSNASNLYIGTGGDLSGKTTNIRGNTVRLYAHTSGAVYLGYSGSTAVTSDENLKNIYDLDDKYLDFFMNLKPISYIYKDNGHRSHLGFGARQVEQALLDADLTTEDFAGVLIDKDVTIGADEAGTEEDVHYDELYSLRYEEFIALNTAMIQKQARIIEQMKKEIEELKGGNE